MLIIQSREISQEKIGAKMVVKAGGIRARRPEFSPGLTTYVTLNKVLDPTDPLKWR